MLLDWLGLRRWDGRLPDAARIIDEAVRTVVDGGTSTRDLGGRASTDEFTGAVVRRIATA
jgi:3-isopropylmalate dehydrogenase